ncbi:MAG: peptidylprolyl isomerase [Acidobacteria bacterium]|nr:peptidylprolyl isomerase [Acidobacteriota bacterium]
MEDQQNPVVELDTSKGAIKIELLLDKAPETVNNFLKYVDEGHYDGTIFHRVIPNFMVQGGGFDEKFSEKSSHPPVKNEADNGVSNMRGTVAMARTSDPHSASAQFFVNVADTNTFLDHSGKTSQGWGYCVFGQVIEGMDAVDSIRNVKTATRGAHQDVPVEAVVIRSARRA